MNQSAICLAGAHRSGTSMLMRLLHHCGLYPGAETDLMPAAADNPDGFWENLRFVKLNDEILNATGAAWDLPPFQDETFSGETFSPIRARAQLLIGSFDGLTPWGWKDPRNCLTMRFWQKLLPDLKMVIIIRNPLEVAYSMHKRNGVSYALGLRLWEIYNRRLLATTSPEGRHICIYQAFFDHPESELQRIVEFAGLDPGRVSSAAALVSTERRHTNFTLDQMISAGVSEQIVALYQNFLAGSILGGKGEKAFYRSSQPDKSDSLAGAKSRLNVSVPEGEDIRQELARRRGDEIRFREETGRHQKVIEGLRAELATKSVAAAAEINRRDGRIEELQKAYGHLDQLLGREQEQRNNLFAQLERTRQDCFQRQLEVSRLAQANERLDQRVQASDAHVTDLETRNATLGERFAQSNQLLQYTSTRLSNFETRNVSLTNRLRKQLLEMKKLLRFLDQIEDASQRLRESRRWRFANPINAILALLSRKPLPGFGHLDNNVEKYRVWRTRHPETARLEEEIQKLKPREIFTDSPAATSRPPVPTGPTPPVPAGPIEFTRYDRPTVSIIIPVFNQCNFTLACLASVQEETKDLPYEVIVVDDHSIDETPERIGRLPGLTYLRSEQNSGFIASCNKGASAARGEYVLFLNNDTTVTPDWLTSLLETFAMEPEAGLVGSKLIYPDGRLQEAGGIIWRDGSGWNRGKFQDASKPEYNYLKEVDYCSAACLLIPQDLFQRLGGFDSKYSPAYYEDTDLAFKVSEQGRKVLYQPLSVVIHYEGITSGTDISAGAKKHQAINRSTFVDSWAARLEHTPVNGDLAGWEAGGENQRRILVIDHHLPMADRDSGSLRMFNILTVLHQLGHRVTFIPDNLADIPPYGDNLRRRGVEVIYHPYAKSIEEYLQVYGRDFDVVILSRRDFAAKHIDNVQRLAPQARLIFDTVDLHFLREEREAMLTQNLELEQVTEAKRGLEYDLIDQSDETWVVSSVEKELLERDRPGKSIEIVSNIVPVPGSTTPYEARRDMLFIGSFQHTPNIDAVLFFARDIFPSVQRQLADARFFIIGDKAPSEIIALTAMENVIVTGFQPDVTFYFDSVKLSVAPLRYGAGVKGKINQSMGFGVPVVATSVAAEGMSLRSEEDILIADDPGSFAEAIVRLYSSRELWNRLSQNSIERTRSSYSIDTAKAQLGRLLSDAHIEAKKAPFEPALSLQTQP